MSVSIRTVTKLLPPINEIDERIYQLRAGSSLYARPPADMMILFIQANHELILPSGKGEVIRSGDICVFPSKFERLYRSKGKSSSSFHALRIVFDETSGSDLRSGAHCEPISFLKNFVSTYRHLTHAISPSIGEYISGLRREFDRNEPGYQFRASTLIFNIITECMRVALPPSDSKKEQSSSRSEILITRAKAFIADNFQGELTLDEIAWQAKVSREHLARTFKQMTGLTVFDYVTFVRIEAAQQLLVDSSLPVKEIARRTGFSSPTLFGRAFKRRVLLTPQAYRQRVLTKTKYNHSILLQ